MSSPPHIRTNCDLPRETKAWNINSFERLTDDISIMLGRCRIASSHY